MTQTQRRHLRHVLVLVCEIVAVLTLAHLWRLEHFPGWLVALWIAMTLTYYALLLWE